MDGSPAARVEILDRLLELNHERARAEGQDVPQIAGQETVLMTVSPSTVVRAELVA